MSKFIFVLILFIAFFSQNSFATLNCQKLFDEAPLHSNNKINQILQELYSLRIKSLDSTSPIQAMIATVEFNNKITLLKEYVPDNIVKDAFARLSTQVSQDEKVEDSKNHSKSFKKTKSFAIAKSITILPDQDNLIYKKFLVEMSPDQSFFVISTENTSYIYSSKDLSKISTFANPSSLHTLKITSDGKYILFVGTFRTGIYSIESGKSKLIHPPLHIKNAQTIKGSDKIIVLDEKGDLYNLDIKDPDHPKLLYSTGIAGAFGEITISPNQKYIVYSNPVAKKLIVLDSNGNDRKIYSGVENVEIDNDSKRLVGVSSGEIHIWDLETLESIETFSREDLLEANKDYNWKDMPITSHLKLENEEIVFSINPYISTETLNSQSIVHVDRHKGIREVFNNKQNDRMLVFDNFGKIDLWEWK